MPTPAQKRARSSSPSGFDPTIYTSEEIEDRKSVFVAHYSPSIAPKTLQNQANIASAMHKILAWRTPSKQSSIRPGAVNYDSRSDEDGEKWAGKKLEKILEEEDVTGAIVVARWFGGQMLGPVRFAHIETCAKEAIQLWRKAAAEEGLQKKRKIEDEAEREWLVKELSQRDSNILALRQLLASKLESTKDKGIASAKPNSSPAKPIHYENMPLDVLRRLDKARDATVAALLKKIDEAEAEFPPAG